MNLADAFAQLDKKPGAQVPKHPSTQEPKRLSTEVPKAPSAQVPKPLSTQAPKRPGAQGLAVQGTGKSSHPDFEAFKVYLRTATKRAAARKYEDEAGGDFSELCEKLLVEYLGA